MSKLIDKIDPVIRKNTLYIAMFVLIGTALMESVFLIIGKWDVTVLWGGLWGAFAAILNFFLMAMMVQKAVTKDKKDAASLMKVSQNLRMLLLVALCAIGAALPAFNLIAVLIPLVFPSIGAKLHSVIVKDQ